MCEKPGPQVVRHAHFLFSLDDKCPPRTETRNTPFLWPVSCFPILKMMIGRVLLRCRELAYPSLQPRAKECPFPIAPRLVESNRRASLEEALLPGPLF